MKSIEFALQGGRMTVGIVRVGDTVRRPISTDRTLVHELLRHAEAEGFEGTPRFLGIDDEGREILSFLPGNVPADLGFYSDGELFAAAALLRRFHDMSVRFITRQELSGEVFCHNDWGPPNAVFRDGLPYGIIDFDTVVPGMRLWDVGYSAFAWLDLGNPDFTGREQVRRLSIFAEGYGHPFLSVADIAAYAVARQSALVVSGRVNHNPEMREWAAAAVDWTVLNVLELVLPTGYRLK